MSLWLLGCESLSMKGALRSACTTLVHHSWIVPGGYLECWKPVWITASQNPTPVNMMDAPNMKYLARSNWGWNCKSSSKYGELRQFKKFRNVFWKVGKERQLVMTGLSDCTEGWWIKLDWIHWQVVSYSQLLLSSTKVSHWRSPNNEELWPKSSQLKCNHIAFQIMQN